MYNIDYWYIDNVLCFNPLEVDGFMLSLNQTPEYFGSPIPVQGTIMNLGNNPITSFEIGFRLDGGDIAYSSFSGLNVPTLGTYDFTTAETIFPPIGGHLLEAWINKVNGNPDLNPENDSLSKTIYRASLIVNRRPLFEEFTSSTCSPCATFNTSFNPWVQQHEDDITLIKYQMNWPGSGDPYYTPEGGVRRTYYGVKFVPDLYVNGAQVATTISAVNTAFNNAVLRPGVMKMNGTHSISGKFISGEATVLPFVDFTGVRFYIVVMEKVTHNNATTNGETSFHHVMMKMIPDAEGTSVTLTERQPYTLTYNMDLSATHIEEFDDLMVGLFVQKYQSKEVYQSNYSTENATFGTEDRLSNILVDGTPLSGFDPDVYSYDYRLDPGTTIVPNTDAIPMDSNATVIILPALQIPGTTTIDVFAEDLKSHKTYEINFYTSGVGIGGQPIDAISIYPVPAKDYLMINGAHDAQISIISTDGRIMLNQNHVNHASLDISHLPAGTYLLRIIQADGFVVQKRFIIAR